MVVIVFVAEKKHKTDKSLIIRTDDLFGLFRALLGLGLFNAPLVVDRLKARLAYLRTRVIFTQNVIQQTDDLKKW